MNPEVLKLNLNDVIEEVENIYQTILLIQQRTLQERENLISQLLCPPADRNGGKYYK